MEHTKPSLVFVVPVVTPVAKKKPLVRSQFRRRLKTRRRRLLAAQKEKIAPRVKPKGDVTGTHPMPTSSDSEPKEEVSDFRDDDYNAL